MRYLSNHSVPFKPKHLGDVGHDLYTEVKPNFFECLISFIFRRPKFIIIWPMSYRYIGSGIHLDMPLGTWCQIHARSSTAKRRLQVLGGVIDSGYQGELFTNIHNFGIRPRIVREGDRLAQVIFYGSIRPALIRVDISNFYIKDGSSRGQKGFGSTGR